MRKYLLTIATLTAMFAGNGIATAQATIPSTAQTAEEDTPHPAAAAATAQQQLMFGYLSYDSVFRAMPEYATAVKQLNELKAKYEDEAERVEKDFNKKYEEFLEGQRDFPPTILQKRQSELQELLDKNITFKEESNRLLKSAEKTIFAPLHAKLGNVLKAIGEEKGYSFIMNTDNNACPFINAASGEDITATVTNRLKQ